LSLAAGVAASAVISQEVLLARAAGDLHLDEDGHEDLALRKAIVLHTVGNVLYVLELEVEHVLGVEVRDAADVL